MFDGLITGDLSGMATTASRIRQGLESVRRHLGMEVAYVSEFVGDHVVFREVDAPGLEALIKPGDRKPLDQIYCPHILAGRLPELMADTADHPLAAAMPITRAVPVGAHMSVPIRLADGQIFGMFCCLSPTPNASLNARDLAVMRVFADLAAADIGREMDAARGRAISRAAIERLIAADQFRFLYQPIMAFAGCQVVGFEALCRFTPEPYRSPDKWFNEAAAAGCGELLELAVLGKALTALNSLPEDTFVSINASPSTILGLGLEAVLEGLPLHRIVLEVTEHAEVGDYPALTSALRPLRARGLRLAIDDAGAGYSSMQHILQLRPDIIKLDMGLTRAVDRDPARRALAAALSLFAKETNCQIVAEGIETAAEFATLERLGVAKGQGYLLGRPADLATACALAGRVLA